MATRNRRGSVYLLVLLVMISSMSLVTGFQHVLVSRTRTLDQNQTRQKMKNALLLGLEESVRLLIEDDDWTVDSAADEWAQPFTFTSTEGVALSLMLEDAQSRLNVNHLSLPASSSMPRTWMDIFSDLIQNAELEVEPRVFSALQLEIDRDEIWFETPELLAAMLSDTVDLLTVSDSLCALPRPANRPLALNINTVRPEVLDAIVGDSLQGWVDSVLATRQSEAIRNPGEVLRVLPTQIQPLLLSILEVRSEYFTARLVARLDQSEQTLTALLKRSGGNVEVIRCQW